MPALEMSQTDATLLRWLKASGAWVEQGEPVMEIETDKMVVEIESPGAGFLSERRAAEGDVVPVGDVVALLLAESELSTGGPSAAADGAPTTASAAIGDDPAAPTPAGGPQPGGPSHIAI